MSSVIGVLLVSHGTLAKSLLETATEIVGPFDATEALAISRHERLEDVASRVQEAKRRVDQGRGVLILVDMFGGTAANIALHLVGRDNVEVVTGCNLPMLLKLASVQATMDLVPLAQLLKAYGQKNVLVASEMLKEHES
jgi:PTS system mannose-specific IIA component